MNRKNQSKIRNVNLFLNKQSAKSQEIQIKLPKLTYAYSVEIWN